MNMLKYLLIFIVLFILEIIYIKIAIAKNIKDNPNHRSAHKRPTLRGGGIILLIAILIFTAVFKPRNSEFFYFLFGTVLVATISFIDDLITLSSRLRLMTHLAAFSLIFYSLSLFADFTISRLLFLIFLYIFSIGYLNIYNFMDGINGLTFLNTTVSYCTLLYLNEYYLIFTDPNLLIVLLIAIIVFGFFNFRNKAICFAGDIGSITIGFSLIYFVLKLYLISKNLAILLIFCVYLLDGGWTIIERVFRKENIFEAHRRHLYQLLANDLKINHLKVSITYFLLQLLVNVLLVVCISYDLNSLMVLSFTVTILSAFYFWIKRRVIKKVRLN